MKKILTVIVDIEVPMCYELAADHEEEWTFDTLYAMKRRVQSVRPIWTFAQREEQ